MSARCYLCLGPAPEAPAGHPPVCERCAGAPTGPEGPADGPEGFIPLLCRRMLPSRWPFRTYGAAAAWLSTGRWQTGDLEDGAAHPSEGWQSTGATTTTEWVPTDRR